jgi:hypothetical protein
MTWHGIEPGSPWWEAGDWLPAWSMAQPCLCKKVIVTTVNQKNFGRNVSPLRMWESVGKLNTHYGIAWCGHIFKNTALFKQVKSLVCHSLSDHLTSNISYAKLTFLCVSWELEAPPYGQWMTVYQLSAAAMSAWHEEKHIPWLLDY